MLHVLIRSSTSPTQPSLLAEMLLPEDQLSERGALARLAGRLAERFLDTKVDFSEPVLRAGLRQTVCSFPLKGLFKAHQV